MKKYCVEYTDSPEHYLFTGEWNQDEAYVEAESEDEAEEIKKAWLVDHDIDPCNYVFRVTDVTEAWGDTTETLKFTYVADLNVGYKEATPMSDEIVREVKFTIEARNRATADRMVKALTVGCTNILDLSGICIG